MKKFFIALSIFLYCSQSRADEALPNPNIDRTGNLTTEEIKMVLPYFSRGFLEPRKLLTTNLCDEIGNFPGEIRDLAGRFLEQLTAECDTIRQDEFTREEQLILSILMLCDSAFLVESFVEIEAPQMRERQLENFVRRVIPLYKRVKSLAPILKLVFAKNNDKKLEDFKDVLVGPDTPAERIDQACPEIVLDVFLQLARESKFSEEKNFELFMNLSTAASVVFSSGQVGYTEELISIISDKIEDVYKQTCIILEAVAYCILIYTFFRP